MAAEFGLADVVFLGNDFGHLTLSHESVERDLARTEVHQTVPIP